MKYDRISMTVQGQKTGEARLTAYLLDPVSVSPERTRPLVIVVPGGGYQYCSDREREPIVMKFLAMGCHACILDYSVSPNRFPVALRELALAIATVRDHAKEWQGSRVGTGMWIFSGRSSGMQYRYVLESFGDV